jgi:hypothetical protein
MPVLPGGSGGGGGSDPGDNTDPLCTPDDIAAFLQTTLTTAQTAAANYLIPLAQAEIEAETGRKLNLRTYTETTEGDGTNELWLQNWPLVSVSTVTEYGAALTAQSYSWTWEGKVLKGVSSLTAYSDWEPLAPWSWVWGTVPGSVTVTYRGGYSTFPAPLKDIAVRMVARALVAPPSTTGGGGQITGETLGDYSVTYSNSNTSGSVMLTDEERAIVKKYKRRRSNLRVRAVRP